MQINHLIDLLQKQDEKNRVAIGWSGIKGKEKIDLLLSLRKQVYVVFKEHLKCDQCGGAVSFLFRKCRKCGRIFE